jgi:hypothetical protein
MNELFFKILQFAVIQIRISMFIKLLRNKCVGRARIGINLYFNNK